MISPTSSTHASNATQSNQAAQPAAHQTQQSRTQPSASQDMVTLSRAAQQASSAQRSTPDVDHDGVN
jgi:hypothetical protein